MTSLNKFSRLEINVSSEVSFGFLLKYKQHKNINHKFLGWNISRTEDDHKLIFPGFNQINSAIILITKS